MAMQRTLARSVIQAALVSAIVTLGTQASAGIYDDNVTKSCIDGYAAYCSQHPHGSAGLRYCFEANRNNLSRRCIEALYDAGEIPHKYLIKQVR